MKNVNRAIRLGKFVAKPIGNFIKRSRSFSGPPPVPPKDQQSDPVARKPLRRRATISEMGDNSREKVGNDDDLPPGLRCLKGPHCPCWKCTETTRFLNGQYDVDPNRPYDPFFGGTGAHGYNEEWDEWNKRIDFIRYKSQMPPEALDLRRCRVCSRGSARSPASQSLQSASTRPSTTRDARARLVVQAKFPPS
jgi:hypothetical protein